MLPISLDYVFLIAPLVLSDVYFVQCLVYPMLPVSLDGIFVIALLVFSDVYCPVSCVPYVASFYGLYIYDCPFGIL